ncbi:MAG: hypothetical protein KAX16_05910, partial [Actinomycetia bacterium]|nr:hypothetical protein [Actinomycetes bacterium]
DYLNLRRPFRVHNVHTYPSWLEYYQGDHPPEAVRMFNDVQIGRIEVEQRPTKDIEKLLRSPRYRLGRYILKAKLRLYSSTSRIKSIIQMRKQAPGRPFERFRFFKQKERKLENK